MPQACAAMKCSHTSRGLCDCCQQQLCIQHLSEHNASLIAQLNPLTDEINLLHDCLKTLNLQKIVGDGYKKLERWRIDCHRQINRFFEQKRQELDRLVEQKVEKQRKDLSRLQSKMVDLIHEQETTRQDIDALTSAIHRLKERIDTMEGKFWTITTRPIQIDGELVCIKETTQLELDLSTFPPIHKTINRPPGSQLAVASNNRFLLIHQKPNLCFVDQDMNIIKEILWNHDDVRSMCWSPTLNRFIVIGGKNVFCVDENTFTIDKVQTIEERKWLCCTCSKDYLFLSTNELGSSIMKYSLVSSIKLITKWRSPQTCETTERVDDMVYTNRNLAIVIINTTEKSLSVQLRSADKLCCIWSLRTGIMCNQQFIFRFCLLTCDEWLVIDYETKRLLQITKDGKLKTTVPYDAVPWTANIFQNKLVVSTNHEVNFHKLS